MMKTFTVGLLHFNEGFGLELLERINETKAWENPPAESIKLVGERIWIREAPMDLRSKYDMIIDRGSHLLKHTMGIFMNFAFQGIYIMNHPLSFHYFIANKDVGYTIADSLGVNVPLSYVLPPYTNHILEEDGVVDHRVVKWDEIIERVGYPCYIKPAEGRGGYDVHQVTTKRELLSCYNASGSKVMTIQKAVSSPYDWHVRCLCIGRKIIPIKYIFRPKDGSSYIYAQDFLTPEQGRKIVDSAKVINQAFGYEMNSVEFILDHDGEPWAIDFNNPIPDARKDVLGEIYYNDYLSAMLARIWEVARSNKHSPFLPDLNIYANIARMNLTKAQKFAKALEVANRYYNEA